MDELLARIAAGRIDPVYLQSSDHSILLDRVLGALRDATVPAAMRAFNYDVIDGKADANRIIAASQTLPMMGPRRMVYVRDLATLPTDDAPRLLEYMNAPNPTTTLVMVTTKLDKRLKLYSGAGKLGCLHVLDAPKNPTAWIRAEAQARSVILDAGAVTRLADAVGSDLSRIALTIEQLGLYAGDRGVTADDVDDLVADTRERTVFELTDAIGTGSVTTALAAVSALCDQRDSAIGVIAMLARHLRQLTIVHECAGAPRGELASRVGAPPFVIDKLVQQSRRFSHAHLSRASAALASADRALKGDASGGGRWSGPQVKALGRQLGERIILEQLIQSIVAT